MTHTILVVDADAAQCCQTQQVIQDKMGYRTLGAHSGRDVVERFLLRSRPTPDLILMNLLLPDMGGMDVIRAVRRCDAQLPIIVLASQHDMRHAAEAIRAGANDFLLKPVDVERLRLSMHNMLQKLVLGYEVDRLSRHHEGRVQFSDMVGSSALHSEVVAQARRAADSIIPVLIEGESGTGKELLAQAIHGSGSRSGKPFVSIHCAAIKADELDALLYGRAAHGRMAASVGKMTEAQGGTVFLKHVDALLPEQQQRLLSMLKHGEVVPQHASCTSGVDVRVMVSSTASLDAQTRSGQFCVELYDMLSRFPLQLAPLRLRQDDVAELAEHFIRRYSAREGKAFCPLRADAARMLSQYHWPGNIRELRHVMVRAVMQNNDAMITPKLVIQLLLGQVSTTEVTHLPDLSSLYAHYDIEEDSSLNLLAQDGNVRRIHEMEAEMIRYAIRYYKGQMSEVARRLGIGRSTLYRKIQDYNLSQMG